AAAGVDAIGLNFWPGTPRRIDFEAARAIVAAVPPMVVVVGLFVDPAAAGVLPRVRAPLHEGDRREGRRRFAKMRRTIRGRGGPDLRRPRARRPARRHRA